MREVQWQPHCVSERSDTGPCNTVPCLPHAIVANLLRSEDAKLNGSVTAWQLRQMHLTSGAYRAMTIRCRANCRFRFKSQYSSTPPASLQRPAHPSCQPTTMRFQLPHPPTYNGWTEIIHLHVSLPYHAAAATICTSRGVRSVDGIDVHFPCHSAAGLLRQCEVVDSRYVHLHPPEYEGFRALGYVQLHLHTRNIQRAKFVRL